jgi:multidrug resistance efflux pump
MQSVYEMLFDPLSNSSVLTDSATLMVQPRLFNQESSVEGEPTPGRAGSPALSAAPHVGEGAEAGQPLAASLPRRVAPQPNRPRGRLIVGLLLLGLLVTALFLVWNTFFRYQAYGMVAGRVVEVPPPWTGVVRALYVREGDTVRQGDVLAVLENPEINESLDRLLDELLVGRAELDAQVARLVLESQESGDRRQRALADYYEKHGELLAEESKLSSLTSTLKRHESLIKRGAVSSHEYEAIRIAESGQRAKLERLKQAVEELQKRAEAAKEPDERALRLKPKIARIEQLQADIRRLRDKLQRGTVRAPESGRVLAIRNYVGEYVEPGDPLIELLRDGSLEVVVFVQQYQTHRFVPGKTIDVQIAPLTRPMRCRVERFADRLEEPPESLAVHFRENEKVLPVIMTPIDPPASGVRLGSEARIAHPWFSLPQLLP